MNIVTTIKEWQAIRETVLKNKSIGFIATMGHLHEGHISLCTRSKEENDVTVVSIFVNPSQFNNPNDFDFYPRTLDQDQALLEENKVDYLFLPDAGEMYPDEYQVQVSETALSVELEGQYRPGHFNGMLTIVLKLLNVMRPTRAYFGEKDYQQYILIKKMADSLFLPIDIIPCQTVRAEDGLALSSRNSRLTEDQREKAASFSQLLRSSLDPEKVVAELIKLGFKVDYIAETWNRRLGAVWLDEVRLIDNICLSEKV